MSDPPRGPGGSTGESSNAGAGSGTGGRTGTHGRTGTGAAITAEGFALDGPRGPVFGEVTFEAPPGSLVAVEGPSGSGRTCLLLALTGRMKATAGRATLGGHTLPRQLAAVRRISALGAVPGVTDLEPSLSVAEQLREQVLLRRRFGGSPAELFRPRRRRAADSRARLDSALSAAGLDLDALPKGSRTRVRDLERLETLRLSVALALLGEPRLLAVDDVDLKLSEAEREEAWALLRSVADSGTTVLAVCSRAPRDAVVVPARTERSEAPDGPDGSDGPARTAEETGKAGKNEGTKEETADALAETGRA